jgi:hypothetical protein
MEVLPLILSHQIEPLYAWNIDIIERLFGYFVANHPYCQDQILPAEDLIGLQFYLHDSKEEEVTWCTIWAIGRMRNSMSTKFCETFIRFPRIVGTCILNMHSDSFQRPSSGPCAYVCKQIRNNNVTEECIIICSPFGHIEQIVDPFDRPNSGNQALFRPIFYLIVFRGPHLWKEPRLIDADIRNKTTTRHLS